MRITWRRIALAALAAAATSGLAVVGVKADPASVAPYAAPQTQVRLPDGRLYNLVCLGEGDPVAVLDVGLRDWSLAWRALQPDLAKITRTCIPDRAGYGFSDEGPLPRDSKAETEDLESALQAVGLRPPYVLVGHSLGGLNARLFAYRNPDKVAGLLLIDPSVSFREFGTSRDYAAKMDLAFYEACAARARAGKLVPGEVRPGDPGPCLSSPDPAWTSEQAARINQVRSKASIFNTTLAEFRSAYDVDVAEVEAARRPLGDVPLVVLTEDRGHFRDLKPWFGDDVDAVYTRWVAGHDDEAHDSTRGRNKIVEGAGHDIEVDRPEAVIAAFKDVVEAVRRAGPTAGVPRKPPGG
jgi:pimeloyl-ACP methyl ester carboxylesterase